MSYILDALRKSEAERRQGKAPDLGQPLQMIHRPQKKRVSVPVWIGLAVCLNAGILGYAFWPEIQAGFEWLPEVSLKVGEVEPDESASPIKPSAEPGITQPGSAPEVRNSGQEGELPDDAVQMSPAMPEYGQPTIIVPRPAAQSQKLTETRAQGRVPHLVELPLSFQKSIPDLTFNSHIVSSNSSASSVMINSQYLRAGDSLGQLVIEQINEEGVVFRKDGRRFRIGTMRNWVSPR